LLRFLNVVRNSDGQNDVMCGLKSDIRQKGRLRRAEDAEKWKGWAGNAGQRREGDTFFKWIKERNKEG
jgi:hypothetical protein